MTQDIDEEFQNKVDNEALKIMSNPAIWAKEVDKSRNYTFRHKFETYTGALTRVIFDDEYSVQLLIVEKKHFYFFGLLFKDYLQYVSGFAFNAKNETYPIEFKRTKSGEFNMRFKNREPR